MLTRREMLGVVGGALAAAVVGRVEAGDFARREPPCPSPDEMWEFGPFWLERWGNHLLVGGCQDGWRTWGCVCLDGSAFFGQATAVLEDGSACAIHYRDAKPGEVSNCPCPLIVVERLEIRGVPWASDVIRIVGIKREFIAASWHDEGDESILSFWSTGKIL